MTIDEGGIGLSALERSDLEQLESVGISRAEAERQLRLLAQPPPAPRLVRPCRLGDGIRSFDARRRSELAERGSAAAAAGRLSKFVPASGAASRMFDTLFQGLESGGEALEELVAQLDRLPFRDELRAAMSAAGRDLDDCVRSGDHAAIVSRLLQTPGLGYGELPKGLLPFHAYEEGSRTAFEEQLVEAVSYARDADGLCRLDFTVPESHRAAFGSLLERLRAPLFERYGARFEVGFSVQSPATDTLAVDPEDRPFRLGDGRLLLRPGGHGALLRNLASLEGDIVLVKNIDNVLPERRHAEIARWKWVLAGYLVSLEERVFELLDDLRAEPPSSAAVEAGLDWLRAELHVDPPARLEGASDGELRSYLIDRLERPLRVCGMVRNEGEPGGGPFWVATRDGQTTPQIVERSQIDSGDATQRSILAASTHFNPVDLACALRRRDGRRHELERFVDPEAVFISRKSLDGRELKALERPGLWNGAMARWNTWFVEVPLATFAPVKTVFDLLRPAHQRG